MIKEYLSYLRDNPHGYWFKARWFGWGFMPVKWQGWLTICIYIIVLGAIATNVDRHSHSVSDTLIGISVPFVICTAIFLALCFWKGEKLHWNWGDPRKK